MVVKANAGLEYKDDQLRCGDYLKNIPLYGT